MTDIHTQSAFVFMSGRVCVSRGVLYSTEAAEAIRETEQAQRLCNKESVRAVPKPWRLKLKKIGFQSRLSNLDVNINF